MKNIGEIIKEIRISKGFSQEELANASLLNLRTIQRIEKNSTKPYPKTLALISEALDVNLEEIIGKENKEDRKYFLMLHLSSLAMIFIPIGNIIAPAIFWYIRKDSIIGLKKTGANLLNFQIMYTIITYLPVAYMLFTGIKGNYNILVFLLFLYLGLVFLNILISVIYAIRAGKGYKQLSYPTLINFI